MRRLLRGVAAGGAGAVAVAVVAAGPASGSPPVTGAVAATTIHSPMPNAYWCRKALDRLELYRSSSAFVPPNSLTILDQTVTVDPANLDLVTTPFTDPSRVMWFRSLLWLSVAAVDAAEKGNRALADQLAEHAKVAAASVPDPGSATPEKRKLASALGWDAGTTMRRAESLLCLSAVTGVEPLRKLMNAQGFALIDPQRYGGPPRRNVSNMGMLANLALLDLAKALNQPDFKQIALGRLIRDQSEVFSDRGWVREGSTSYHSVNVDGWRDVQEILRNQGYAAEANAMEPRLAAATETAAQLIGPTRAQALIGNSRPTDVVLRPKPKTARPLLHLDSAGGLAVGRWSWTDRRTTWWTAQNRLVRGPHGHDDNLSITWQTAGVPVLIDPGQPDYDRKNNQMTAWSASAVAHNRPVPPKPRRDSTKVRQLKVVRSGQVDEIRMVTSDQGPLQTRRVLIDAQRRSVEVVDDGGHKMTQYWHLGPGWTSKSVTSHAAVLTGPGGRVLTVTSPEGRISALAGSMDPIGGWHVVGFERLLPATELRVSGSRNLTTTFALTRSAKAKPAPIPVISAAGTTIAKRSVTLRWAIPGQPTRPKAKRLARKSPFAKVVGYRLQVRAPGQPWRTLRVDTRRTTTKAKLARLTPDTPYRFRVAALTATSISPYSKARRFTPQVVKVNKRSGDPARRAGTR